MELYSDEGAKGGKNKSFVIFNSSNAAEQFHLPSCQQFIILSPEQKNTFFFISKFMGLPECASIQKGSKVSDWSFILFYLFYIFLFYEAEILHR